MTIVAFTWQRYHKPLNQDAATWRRLEKVTMANEQSAPHPYAGMSVLDILWQDLDDAMDQLMGEGRPGVPAQWDDSGLEDIANEQMAWGELRGQAQGLAFAIAIITNPYAADVPAVKKEAMARWESRQDG